MKDRARVKTLQPGCAPTPHMKQGYGVVPSQPSAGLACELEDVDAGLTQPNACEPEEGPGTCANWLSRQPYMCSLQRTTLCGQHVTFAWVLEQLRCSPTTTQSNWG